MRKRKGWPSGHPFLFLYGGFDQQKTGIHKHFSSDGG
jgi:hypothetical protein